MMKRLLFCFTLLFIAVYSGVQLAGDAGYVLFSYKDWSIELSLWFFILSILLIIFVYYIFSRTFFSILNAFRDSWRCVFRRKAERAINLMRKTFFALILKDWLALKQLLPSLRKHELLTHEEFSAFELAVYHSCLIQDFSFWNNMPKRFKNNINFLADYCDYLIKAEQHDEAESLLKHALNKKWDPRLIRCYGQVKSHKPLKQLAWAKIGLKSHGDDPDLLCCLGRLNMTHSIWGLARDYLQASIHAGGGPEVHYELAKVFEQLGDQSAALDCYKAAASQLLA